MSSHPQSARHGPPRPYRVRDNEQRHIRRHTLGAGTWQSYCGVTLSGAVEPCTAAQKAIAHALAGSGALCEACIEAMVR